MKLSIIIPVYNEQSTVKEVVGRICALALPLEKEIIIVEDGSSDESPEIVAELARLHPDIIKVYVSLINLGKGCAIRTGLVLATGDIILIQDADLELNPEEYPQLLAPILQGKTDVVYGSRFKNKSNKIPLTPRLANFFLTFLTNILYKSSLSDMATAYKVFRRDIVKNIRLTSTGFEFEPEITAKLLLLGHKIIEVPISYDPRSVLEGKKINWRDGFKYTYALLKYRFLSFLTPGIFNKC
ncbi:MAG: glycosyltransferase family 2 protein [Candidatus Omnitrophica bacterium]|nr:glycosyltransferase family 2 protein [Candidatus Omnitrophota bacterium]